MASGSPDWLSRYRSGEDGAFEALVAQLGPRLLGYFLRQGAQPATAEDLAQQVFLRLLQHAHRYTERGNLDAYVLRIARNLWIDHQRRRRLATGTAAAAETADPGPGPAEEADRLDRGEAIRRALGELDAATRELLELAVLQRLPYQEVSGILGIPVGTVKSRVFYSLRRLRERVADFEGARSTRPA